MSMIEKSYKNEELGIEFESYIDEDCCVWFKAKNVAQILGYKNTDDAVKRHVSENHKRTFLFCCPRESRGQQNDNRGKLCCYPEMGYQQNDTRGKYCIFIDESGFYELVFKSRLPTAKIFREWLFTKVLPSIRKYGYFNMFKSKRKKRVLINSVKFYKHDVFTNYAANKDGDVINVKTGRIKRMSKNNSGYLFFSIYNKKLKKTITYYQHRFVYEVFKGKIPPHLETDHINNIKTDNRIKNLQLLTSSQNKQKSFNKPIISTCIETGKEIRFKSLKKASIELNINHSDISNICRKRKHHKTARSKKDGYKYSFKFID